MPNGIKVSPFEDTRWINLSTYVDYRKINGVVYVRITGSPSTVGSWVEHGNLPQEYRPSTNIYTCSYNNSYAYVGANGSVQTIATSVEGANIPTIISYPYG